jgi:hypothetical protein
MKIINIQEYQYQGFDQDSNYHMFTATSSDEIIGVREAKIIVRPANVVILAKQSGVLEPTYSTQRIKSRDEIEAVFREYNLY